MDTAGIASITALTSIASDLGLHFLNYGVPRVWDLKSYTSPEGTQNIGTITGVATVAITSGIASEELKATIDIMPEPYDRLVARSAVASSFLTAKTIAQTSAVLAYAYLVPNGGGFSTVSEYTLKQLAPSLMINAGIGFIIPYAFSN